MPTDPDPAAIPAIHAFEAAREAWKENQIVRCMRLLAETRRIDPQHYQAARLQAAILTAMSRRDDATRLMVEFFERYPLRVLGGGSPDARAAILKIRGFAGTELILRYNKNNRISTTFRGGHFTTDFLLLDPPLPFNVFTVASDALLQPGVVPDHQLMLNCIAEPDLERLSLERLVRYRELFPNRPIINAPDKVLQVSRDQNYQRLKERDGIRFPETHRVTFDAADPVTVANAIQRLGLADGPVIVRATGTHTARSVGLVHDGAGLARHVGPAGLTGEHYLIRYHEELWQGRYFRKLRLFWIDDQFYPVVCHLDETWNVHGSNRKTIMKGNSELMAEEQRFLTDWKSYVGADNADRLESLSDLVELDFFGIDFTIDGDGQILIYEMNPAMRHSFDHSREFAYKLPVDQAISDAFDKMVRARMAD